MALRLGRRLLLQQFKLQSCDALSKKAPTVGHEYSYCSTHFPPHIMRCSDCNVVMSTMWRRLFGTSKISLGNVEVQIQSMGESITEGSVAEVLKEKGDSVTEDETIAQIETDKVTIDIKSPVAGKVSDLRVKVGDTVKVGQVVGIIAEGADKGSKKEEPKPSSGRANEGGESSTSSPATEAQSAYKPSICFPNRRTEDGKRITDLPANEQERYNAKSSSDSSPAPGQATQTKGEPQPKKQMPWYVGKEQGTKLSQSRVLSQREMEQIELGGAEP